MATILKEFKEIKFVSSYGETYVCFRIDGEERYIKINDLYIADNDSKSRPADSIKEIKKALKDGKLYEKIGSKYLGKIIPNTEFNLEVKLYEKELYLPNAVITDQYQGRDGAEKVPVGLNRVLEVQRQSGLTGKYVYCKLADKKDLEFCALSELGYADNDGKFVSLESLGDAVTNELLESKRIFNSRTGKLVESIFTSASCDFGKVIDKERIDDEKSTRTYFEYDKKGNVYAVETQVEPTYSEHLCRKTNSGETVIDSYNYHISKDRSGEFIRVQYEGYNVDSLVNIAAMHELLVDGKPGDPIGKNVLRGDDRFNLIGKRVCVLLENEEGKVVSQITKPLTMEQVAFIYDKLMSMQETKDSDDILSDNSYLKLANGKYIKESEVAHPNCYDFIDNETADFDAYYVIVNTAEGKKGIIVDKNAFNSSMKIARNGFNIELSNAYKLKKSHKSMQDCDVIQTTKTNSGTEQCETLSNPRYENGKLILERNSKEENADIVAKAQQSFENKYRAGNYALDEVLDDEGNYVRLKDQSRYVYSDHITMLDSSHYTSEYRYFNNKTLTYDGKKFNGKPFNMSQANASAYEKLFALFLVPFTSGGFLTCGALAALASSVFMVPTAVIGGVISTAFIGIPVASAVAVPIVNAIKAAVLNNKNHIYKNKMKLQRESLVEELYGDFEFINDQTKIASKEHRLNKNLMLDRFEQMEQKIYSLSEGKLFSDFRMVKGKGKVDETNAELFSKYRSEMHELEKDIKRLEKRVKKDPSLAPELEKKKEIHKQKLNDYVSQGVIESKDNRMKQLLDKNNMLKGYLIKRYYSEGLSKQEEENLDSVYDDLIATKGQVYVDNLAELNPAVLQLSKECLELGRNTHYDYDKNVVDAPKYEVAEPTVEPVVEETKEVEDTVEEIKEITENYKNILEKSVADEIADFVSYYEKDFNENKDAYENKEEVLKSLNYLKAILMAHGYDGYTSPYKEAAIQDMKTADSESLTEKIQSALDLVANAYANIPLAEEIPEEEVVEEEKIANEDIPPVNNSEQTDKAEENKTENDEQSYELEVILFYPDPKLEKEYTELLGLTIDANIKEINKAYYEKYEEYKEDQDKLSKLNSARDYYIKKIGKESWSTRSKLVMPEKKDGDYIKSDEYSNTTTINLEYSNNNEPTFNQFEYYNKIQTDNQNKDNQNKDEQEDKSNTDSKEDIGNKKNKVSKDNEPKKTQKKRLSPNNLKKLFKDIEDLRELDGLYFGPDDDLPSDIEKQIASLEAKIKLSQHMLKSASNNTKYSEFRDQIVEAENHLNEHIVFKGNAEKLNISRNIL